MLKIVIVFLFLLIFVSSNEISFISPKIVPYIDRPNILLQTDISIDPQFSSYQPLPPSMFMPPPSRFGKYSPYLYPTVVQNKGGVWYMIPHRSPNGNVWYIPRKASDLPVNQVRQALKLPPLPVPLLYPSPPRPWQYYTSNPSGIVAPVMVTRSKSPSFH